MGNQNKSKHERWATSSTPRRVNCRRINDHLKGKMFELLNERFVELWPIDAAEDFTREAWIMKHDLKNSLIGASPWPKQLKRNELFMVLGGITLIRNQMEDTEIERLEKVGHWLFEADWFWLVLYKEKLWMFQTRGRLGVIPHGCDSKEALETC